MAAKVLPKKSSLRSLGPSQSAAVAKPKTIGAGEIHTAIQQLAQAIATRAGGEGPLILLGIANGGIPLAHRLAAELSSSKQLKRNVRVGSLDISFHRDDIGRNPIPKEFNPTVLPADINNAMVVLVDDVLFS